MKRPRQDFQVARFLDPIALRFPHHIDPWESHPRSRRTRPGDPPSAWQVASRPSQVRDPSAQPRRAARRAIPGEGRSEDTRITTYWGPANVVSRWRTMATSWASLPSGTLASSPMRDTTTVREVMRSLEELHTITPDTQVLDALKLMTANDVNQLPVVANGTLQGTVARSHLMQLLQANSELQLPGAHLLLVHRMNQKVGTP